MSNTNKKMLTPCSPCCCPGAPCEQCMFGYNDEESNHRIMKDLILKIANGGKPIGWRNAETYMDYHKDWREEICWDGEVVLPKENIEVNGSEPQSTLKKYEIKYIDGEPYVIHDISDDESTYDAQIITLGRYVYKYLRINTDLITKYALMTDKNGPYLTIEGLVKAITADILKQGYVEHESRD